MSLAEVCNSSKTVNGESIAFVQKRTEYLYNKEKVITIESEFCQDADGNERNQLVWYTSIKG